MPSPIHKGILMFGWNPVAFDTVVSDIMGFDYMKIPSIRESYGQGILELAGFAPDDIIINVDSEWDEKLNDRIFMPASGWEGHIERER